MEYIKRLIDIEIDKKSKVFNAINIVGPKGCGKTRTCKERSKTIIEFQDKDKINNYELIANTKPSLFLNYEKPILFDEWQDIPVIWDVIRKDCDDNIDNCNSYFLTGSTSKNVETSHTGTLRICEIKMYPFIPFELGESSGEISLSNLLRNNDDFIGKINNLTIEDLFYIVCRGGWPRMLAVKEKEDKLLIAKEYFNEITSRDISSFDKTKRNSEVAKIILKSYARNIATTCKKKVIYDDVKANYNVSDDTISQYISVLEKLFIIYDIEAWTPQIRSKTAIRNGKKHIFIDPSLGAAALGIGPSYFEKDFDLFGHFFESLVLRDLLVFAEINNAKIKHYHDDFGLEVDAIYEEESGDYALIEIKLNVKAVSDAEKNLLRFKEIIHEHNKKALLNKEHPKIVFREPSSLIVICANAPFSYITEKGIKVIPYGCLKN